LAVSKGKTLPAASNAYSRFRLKKNKQKTPEIEKLMEQEYRYVAAQDVSDSIQSVYFLFM
jgi:hypothetical protein